MSKEGKTGVTTSTPANIMFGAGTFHKNLTYTTPTYALTSDTAIDTSKTYYTRSGTSGNYTYTAVTSPVVGSINSYYEQTGGGWNFDDSIIGATQGGGKFSIVPNFVDIEADGALVLVRGLKVKCGETATMETNALEISKDIIKSATIGQDGTSPDATNYDAIESKALLEDGDYLDNVAFVGQTLDGRDVIVIMENVLVTSGLSVEGKNKEAGVTAYTFTCHADLDSDLDTLPWQILYPKTTA